MNSTAITGFIEMFLYKMQRKIATQVHTMKMGIIGSVIPKANGPTATVSTERDGITKEAAFFILNF